MIRRCFAYLWSGWGSIASLLLLLAAWQWASEHYGELVLPAPLDSLRLLSGMLSDSQALEAMRITAGRVLAGYLLALLAGSLLGILSGMTVTGVLLARPILTLLMGVPPIAWLVLALIWFGSGHGTPVFTVFIAGFPLIFIGALQGMRTRDPRLDDMARSLRLPAWQRFVDVHLPHVLSYLFPAWITALGMAWKVVVMAELLSTPDGVGAALASAQSQLDTAATLAWVAALVLLLLALEYLVLEPIKRSTERWRQGT